MPPPEHADVNTPAIIVVRDDEEGDALLIRELTRRYSGDYAIVVDQSVDAASDACVKWHSPASRLR